VRLINDGFPLKASGNDGVGCIVLIAVNEMQAWLTQKPSGQFLRKSY